MQQLVLKLAGHRREQFLNLGKVLCFTATEDTAFVKFANGWTISVQWGPWNEYDA